MTPCDHLTLARKLPVLTALAVLGLGASNDAMDHFRTAA